MSFRVLPTVLVRAPLLPLTALLKADEALRNDVLGPTAVELGSADLAAAGDAGQAAWSRYGRRAAFRPTPSGWLAGVTLGQIGDGTRVATGPAVGTLSLSWARAAAWGRALLDDPGVRKNVRARPAPSLLHGRDGSVRWLSMRGDALTVAEAFLDAPTDAVLQAAHKGGDTGTPWSRLRAAARAGFALTDDPIDGPDELDQFLLWMVDEDVLHTDLRPPLVGRSPLAWCKARASTLSDLHLQQVSVFAKACKAADLKGAQKAAKDAPGSCKTAVLGHLAFPQAQVQVDRSVVERAAQVAPLLFRLQAALMPPVAERRDDGGLRAQLDAIADLYGVGSYAVPDLATGAYGLPLAQIDDVRDERLRPELPVVAALTQALVSAARTGQMQIDVADLDLDAFLPAIDPLPSFELFLTPTKDSHGWLLGLHGPAGATWGRYVQGLGDKAHRALVALHREETRSDPMIQAVDVAFAASPDLADLGQHPPVRGLTLALLGWPEGPAIAASQVQVVIDSGGISLRGSSGPIDPRPLHRVRSTMVPAGMFRLLAGWSFTRQHAPWAFTWGPLADLPWLPRVVADGFVVAPQSWRLPFGDDDPAAFAQWRQDQGIPRWVQVGQGDELLPVDLDSADGVRDLRRHAPGRVFEIWPPVDDVLDADGRRIEIVAMVVSEPDEDLVDRPPAGTLDRVPTPIERHQKPDPWVSYKLFGPPARQDEVLAGLLAPIIYAARAGGQIDRWFFQRYVDGPGTRPHLRVRARGVSPRKQAGFVRRLLAQIAIGRNAGVIVGVETMDYVPEDARFGGAAIMDGAERLFEAGSDLAVQIARTRLSDESDADDLGGVIQAFESLVRGAGLGKKERFALARRLRAAYEQPFDDEWRNMVADAYRKQGRDLQAAVRAGGADSWAAFQDAVKQITGSLSGPGRRANRNALPVHLHLLAVRLLGADSEREARAFVLWERTLDSLDARGL